ncbi:MAG: FAD-dependent oxidoreductase [Bacteroidota bacterium]
MNANNNKNQNPVNENITSGDNISYWLSSIKNTLAFEKLNQDIDTDILVIGGGISGLTTAYCLAEKGRKVILVEDGNLGSGETGRTTAHLTCALDDRYYDLEKTFNKKTAHLAAQSHIEAIEWIDKTIKLNRIDCNFKYVDGYLFSHPSDNPDNLDKEYEALKNTEIKNELLENIPFVKSEDGKPCIKFYDQAQFHVLKYLNGLADAFIKLGGKIYTQTKAENITSEGATANGFKIKAKHIVVATNTPINDWVTIHTKQWPYRSYVVGAKIRKGKLPYALWWDTGDADSQWLSQPYHYVRLEEFDEQYDILIAGGEDHRTGQTDDENLSEIDRYEKLEQWTKKHFPDIEKFEYRWSGQIMEPLDSLAYIGKNPGDDNIYIITGDSGNGMTHGTLGGMIITDIIMERENPYVSIYDPSRITLNVAKDYLEEVGNMIVQLGDWFTTENIENLKNLPLGEGGVFSSGFKKIAIFRDLDNKLHSCSAVCPHLGGILQWNPDEKTFDCPLHGSRFTVDGKVINGPASSNLKNVAVTFPDDE